MIASGGNAAFLLGGFVLPNLGRDLLGSEGNMGYFVAGCIAFATFMLTVFLLPDRRPTKRYTVVDLLKELFQTIEFK